MCLDSTLDLWQPGHFEVKKWCAALGFFYLVNLDMDNSLKWVFLNMVSGQTISDTLPKYSEVFLLRIWLYFFIPKGGRKCPHTNSYNFEFRHYSWSLSRLCLDGKSRGMLLAGTGLFRKHLTSIGKNGQNSSYFELSVLKKSFKKKFLSFSYKKYSQSTVNAPVDYDFSAKSVVWVKKEKKTTEEKKECKLSAASSWNEARED